MREIKSQEKKYIPFSIMIWIDRTDPNNTKKHRYDGFDMLCTHNHASRSIKRRANNKAMYHLDDLRQAKITDIMNELQPHHVTTISTRQVTS